MSTHPPHEKSRRHVLSGGLAAVVATLILPHPSLAITKGTSIRALGYDGDALAAASRGALWRVSSSNDIQHLPLERSITKIASHPETPGTLFAAVDPVGLIRSRDGGRTWADASAGLPATRVTALTQAALEPDMLYAALADDGLWRSQDAGESWEFVMDRPYLNGAEREVLTLVSVGNPTGMGGIWLYAGTDAGLTRVPDCFCRWQDVTAGDAMDALAAGKTPPPAKPLPEGQPVRHLALSPKASERLYAGLESGLWTSTDAGVNWTRAAAGKIDALAVDPVDPQHLAAVRNSILCVSRDGGMTFEPLNILQGDQT
ncbi:exo-alpha-sialidase [Sulfitobacter sp. W027]|uniref:exo-alpha-sialidase n=1 Tax=Sulfitobacter sp. W027 TaxID=2867025 RepID=UPI0021A854CD|nr:exo-alpha-sialidase [Sulfitobacter sp. W027]UWR32319.1 exo-alpha-sialidase [Sulfitobacter sp. W027]